MPCSGVLGPIVQKTGPQKPLKAFGGLQANLGYLGDSLSQSLHPAMDRTGNRRRLDATTMMFLAPHSKQRMIH